ncbi:MAG: GNAT family N-acetyltransferase [Gammaproteobacteria bacterium]|nr:GNAT family N-acetyltransferase [Gammaproteobacteria bacterium]MBU1557312.1 GNAT family N-acetyltransferase [Gammaproteobacteria bacterium]MBU2070918.1 GNAT family N-acetyltransferase [Gammaproteobacteria bacterium]MBU2181574.1 GNAT family N-acetyltransferase [Gammaproteobacteria bacterium]MBU2204848.1 GNAT family N-acetyltransferase [Gammaproteobacteria bacterium]
MAITALLAQLQQWQQQAAQLHIRLPVIWQGTAESLLSYTADLLSLANYHTLYWLGADAPADAINLTGRQNYQLLGSECDILVINAFAGFNADLVAASAGCVKAGGIWLLLCPPFTQWQQQANPAHARLLPYPLDAASHQGHFIAFWLSRLQQQNVVVINNTAVSQQLTWPDTVRHDSVPAPCITGEQQAAVAAILHVVSGHRRRPLVISADRGRGKSAALGIAAALLAKAGKQLLITAPSPLAAQTALAHFQQLSDAALHNHLQFVPFDQLLRSDQNTDLLLVDEAAAIPTPVLQQLLQRFSRIVFASTEHGYEGTGRGFQLRFQQYLAKQCPGWKKLHIQQAIRYQPGDPLEQLTFAGFLLQQNAADAVYHAASPVSFACYRAKDWLDQTDKLAEVFSLLSLAHYQTQVKDLAALLDNPQLQVISIEQNNRLLACALISIEGDIDNQLAIQIYHGKRRVQGHLLAQSLAFHLAQPELAQATLWRVMRIAVQPALQRQKLGSRLLTFIAQQATQQSVSYLGSSFGATAELLQFWRNAGYLPLRLGTTTDNASNEYSILMLKAITADPVAITALSDAFAKQLFVNLTLYPLLHQALVMQLVAPPNSEPLTTAALEQLALFGAGLRPYELVRHLIFSWFNQYHHQLPQAEAEILCALLWQRADLSTVAQQYGFNGKKQLLDKMSKLVRLHCQPQQ